MQGPATYLEPELLARVAAGEEAAFSRLFHEWQPFLSTHIFRITESRELTAEIVQDVFMKIWESREALSEVRNFKAYLLVISKNHALNAMRKVTREFERWVRYAKDTKAEDNPDPQAAYYSLIDEAISQLSERQRDIYILSRHERLSRMEIARRLGISPESVKTHLKLAIDNITRYVKGRLAAVIILLLLQG